MTQNLTRFWKFTVSLKIPCFVRWVLKNHVSFAILVVTKANQNDVSTIYPDLCHINTSVLLLCHAAKNWRHVYWFLLLLSWQAHQAVVHSDSLILSLQKSSPFPQQLDPSICVAIIHLCNQLRINCIVMSALAFCEYGIQIKSDHAFRNLYINVFLRLWICHYPCKMKCTRYR